MSINTRFIKIDSLDRTSGTYSNFTIQSYFVLNGTWRLAQIYIPNSFYNISTTNNQLVLLDNGSTKAITLPSGFWTADNIPTSLASALNTASNGYNTYTVTIDSLTTQLHISASNAFQIQFSGVSNTCATMFGFVDQTNTATATTITSPNPINLSPTKSYNIRINSNNANILKISSGQLYSLHIPPAINSTGLQVYEAQTFMQYVNFQNTNQVTVGVYDDNDVLIPLQSDWSMVFERTQ